MRGFKRYVFVLRHTGAIHIFWSFLAVLSLSAAILSWVEPNIETFGDGLWYCFIAATTVGFGDLFAITFIGRVITIIVVLYGIVAAATIPGVVLAYYLEYIKAREKATVSTFLEKLENLPNLSKDELTQISEKVKGMKKDF